MGNAIWRRRRVNALHRASRSSAAADRSKTTRPPDRPMMRSAKRRASSIWCRLTMCFDAVFAAHPIDQFKDPQGRCRIEARNRFVGKDRPRALDERPRHANALLLSAGQLIGAAERAIQQPDTLQHIEAKAPLGAIGWKHRPQGRAECEPAKQDVLQRRLASDQMVLLEDHRGALAMTAQRRAARENRSPSPVTTSPRDGLASPLRHRSRVDLPAPDGPSRAMKRP